MFTVEYTHNKRRGLLSSSGETQQAAEAGFRRTVSLMTGTAKELHLDTIKKFDTTNEAHAYAIDFAKKLGRPEPTDATIAENAARVFPKPFSTSEADKDE